VRRGLLSIQLDNGEIQLGLATRLALMYLAAEGVELQPVGNTTKRSLGKAVFTPFNQNDGGYIRADAGGFQILLNFRGTESSFHHLSIVDVLKGNIPEDLMRDRIVLIGSTAPSLNDLFTSPYADERDKSQYLAGVFIHANITSQILSAALDGRKLIKVVSGYLLFLSGWWLPVATPLLALIGSTVVVSNYHQQNQKKLAFIDGLTQIPNRRFFDQFLEQHWLEGKRKHQSLCLILCDVDYFKKYNDTYGHQAGDLCLQKVAEIINQAVGSNDLAARYGGEEFAVIIPNASPEVAIMIAKKISDHLRALQLPHSSSQASEYVSLSCGVASTSKNLVTSPENLIKQADLALYQAKEQGRDRVVLA
jgi:adenylate cyclase